MNQPPFKTELRVQLDINSDMQIPLVDFLQASAKYQGFGSRGGVRLEEAVRNLIEAIDNAEPIPESSSEK